MKKEGGKNLEDSQIILLLRNSPSDGLYEAILKYRDYAAAIASRILGGTGPDAEECVEDAFVSIWKYARDGDGIRSLKGCVACSVRSAAINRRKQFARRNAVNIDDLELAAEDDVVLQLESEGDAIVVQELVGGMDEPDREIFVRKYFLFESIREISRRTMLDETQIKNRLYRGRQKLRKQLKERNIAYESE